MLKDSQVEKLIRIRRELHSMPEVSGDEKKTAAYIKEKLEEAGADKIVNNLGGHGLIAIFNGEKTKEGQSLMIRSELDALAIHEQNEISYRSGNSNRMHACGHDGHMTIVLGVAEWLKENKPDRGRVILLFQPAEEIGKGAGWMINDPKFENMQIDRGIALHNLPGYKKNTIYIRNKTFALASVGVKISFKGKSSHAAYPEEGNNPSIVISRLIQRFEDIKKRIADNDQFQVLTITYIKVGEPAFGMNPGTGEMGVTIRAETEDDMNELFSDVQNAVKQANEEFNGKVHYKKKEPFTATINDPEGVDQLKRVGEELGLNIESLKKPIGWSEDFGKFRKKCPITIFGLGAGEESPPLHTEIYDFDDDLISVGVHVFCKWISSELNDE